MVLNEFGGTNENTVLGTNEAPDNRYDIGDKISDCKYVTWSPVMFWQADGSGVLSLKNRHVTGYPLIMGYDDGVSGVQNDPGEEKVPNTPVPTFRQPIEEGELGGIHPQGNEYAKHNEESTKLGCALCQSGEGVANVNEQGYLLQWPIFGTGVEIWHCIETLVVVGDLHFSTEFQQIAQFVDVLEANIEGPFYLTSAESSRTWVLWEGGAPGPDATGEQKVDVTCSAGDEANYTATVTVRRLPAGSRVYYRWTALDSDSQANNSTDTNAPPNGPDRFTYVPAEDYGLGVKLGLADNNGCSPFTVNWAFDERHVNHWRYSTLDPVNFPGISPVAEIELSVTIPTGAERTVAFPVYADPAGGTWGFQEESMVFPEWWCNVDENGDPAPPLALFSGRIRAQAKAMKIHHYTDNTNLSLCPDLNCRGYLNSGEHRTYAPANGCPSWGHNGTTLSIGGPIPAEGSPPSSDVYDIDSWPWWIVNPWRDAPQAIQDFLELLNWTGPCETP